MMKKEYQRPAMKVRRIDMAGALLAGDSTHVGQGTRDDGGWKGNGAKDFTFDDEEEDEGLKPYNPWE